MQTVIISGNLGRDPELRYTPNGTAVVAFSMATKERKKNDNGAYTDETVWWRVTAWGSTAEYVAKNLKKGMRVLVLGKVAPDPATGAPRIWTDKDGKSRASFELNATMVESQQRLEQ